MEIQELIVGDWVLDGEKIAQIVLVTCDRIVGTTFNESSNIEVIKPIPLTPEILEKNGFKSIYQNYKNAYKWQEYDNDNNSQRIIIDFKCKCICEVSNDKTRKLYKGEIVYVHELQHALKLCGIEKEIVI